MILLFCWSLTIDQLWLTYFNGSNVMLLLLSLLSLLLQTYLNIVCTVFITLDWIWPPCSSSFCSQTRPPPPQASQSPRCSFSSCPSATQCLLQRALYVCRCIDVKGICRYVDVSGCRDRDMKIHRVHVLATLAFSTHLCACIYNQTYICTYIYTYIIRNSYTYINIYIYAYTYYVTCT